MKRKIAKSGNCRKVTSIARRKAMPSSPSTRTTRRTLSNPITRRSLQRHLNEMKSN